MTAYDLVVRAPRAVVGGAERACAVAVRGGTIAELAPLDAPLDAAETVELGADVVLLPGLVDSHVHVDEPGRTEWEGFATATRAAAAGGVTTIVDMPLNSVPPTVDVAALEVKRAAARGQCAVDVVFWGGAVPGNVRHLRPLLEAGAVGVKCFLLDSGVEEFPALDRAGLEAAMTELAQVDGLLVVHAEDAATIARAPAPAGRSYSAFLRSRPPEAETAAVAEVIACARRTGARAHVVHLSAADALPLLAAARAEGVRVSAETCPHYLVLAAEQVPEGATAYKCCPPVRGSENRERLWQGLRDGTISCVVSDHSPCTPELKRPGTGDFAAAWGGISSLQLGLPLVWTAASERGATLVDVVRWMAEGPADLTGLRRKGRIAVGADADLCAVAPDEPFVVDAAALHHRHPVTPYDGLALRGVVRATWLRGRRTGGAAHGELIAGGPA